MSRARSGPRQAVFLVMGGTGTGKSTFINIASDSNLEVSDSLQSVTREVALSNEFTVDGVSVTLVDTPGFDDTSRSDTQILASLASFLVATFESDIKVNGILYLHSISNPRVGGASKRNIALFQEICGTQGLKNSLIVTNMWSLVTDMAVAEKREKQLQTEDLFFKPALDSGAQMVRHDGTQGTAIDIIRKLLDREPASLRLQEELVTEGLPITETRASNIIDEGVTENRKKFERELIDLKEELTEVMSEGDDEAKEHLEALFKETEAKVKALDQSRDRLAAEMQDEKANAEGLVQELKRRTPPTLPWYKRLIQLLFGGWNKG